MLAWIVIFLLISVLTATLAFTRMAGELKKWSRFFFFIFAALFLASLFAEMIQM